jgi:hypothetical protein
MIISFIQRFHAPSFLVSFLTVLAGQIVFHGVSISGQNVDLSSQTGVTAAVIAILGAIIYALSPAKKV